MICWNIICLYIICLFPSNKQYKKDINVFPHSDIELEISDIAKLALQLTTAKQNENICRFLWSVIPIVLQLELIYQSLCKEKEKWTAIVPKSIRKAWDKFIEKIRHTGKINISRLFFNLYDESCFLKFMDLQMHHLKPTVALFTCDVFWVTPIWRHYCAPKVV